MGHLLEGFGLPKGFGGSHLSSNLQTARPAGQRMSRTPRDFLYRSLRNAIVIRADLSGDCFVTALLVMTGMRACRIDLIGKRSADNLTPGRWQVLLLDRSVAGWRRISVL